MLLIIANCVFSPGESPNAMFSVLQCLFKPPEWLSVRMIIIESISLYSPRLLVNAPGVGVSRPKRACRTWQFSENFEIRRAHSVWMSGTIIKDEILTIEYFLDWTLLFLSVELYPITGLIVAHRIVKALDRTQWAFQAGLFACSRPLDD